MALYAFDGTGNEDREGELRDSNVLRFFEAYGDPKKNTDPDEKIGSLYLNGIGTRAKEFVGKALAEAFGIGGQPRGQGAAGHDQRAHGRLKDRAEVLSVDNLHASVVLRPMLQGYNNPLTLKQFDDDGTLFEVRSRAAGAP